MNVKDFNSMLEQLAVGWTSLEYEEVAAHFADNLFYSDSLNYSFNNRQSLLEFFCDDEGKPQLCEFHNSVFDEERQIGVAEYTYEGTFRYHGTAWIEIQGDKIVSWREYQHRSDKDWTTFWKIDERDRS